MLTRPLSPLVAPVPVVLRLSRLVMVLLPLVVRVAVLSLRRVTVLVVPLAVEPLVVPRVVTPLLPLRLVAVPLLLLRVVVVVVVVPMPEPERLVVVRLFTWLVPDWVEVLRVTGVVLPTVDLPCELRVVTVDWPLLLRLLPAEVELLRVAACCVVLLPVLRLTCDEELRLVELDVLDELERFTCGAAVAVCLDALGVALRLTADVFVELLERETAVVVLELPPLVRLRLWAEAGDALSTRHPMSVKLIIRFLTVVFIIVLY